MSEDLIRVKSVMSTCRQDDYKHTLYLLYSQSSLLIRILSKKNCPENFPVI